MSTPRRLVLWMLISLCAAMVAAQSSPDKNAASSQPASAQPQNSQASTDLFQLQLAADVEQVDPSQVAQPALREGDSLILRPPDSRRQHILTLGQNEATCYTLRTYRVARENPESDTTRPAGYSTCQRATRFQLRTAVDSREITPR
jgi:hypothetical protein